MSIASGMLDVATGDTAALAMIERAHPEVAKQVKVIWRSDPMPGIPVVWRKDLDPSVKEKLRAFVLGYGKAPGGEGERQRAFLASIGIAAFTPADDDHLLPVREMEATAELAAARRTHDAAAVRREEQELVRVRKAEAKAAAPGA
jgi:phosphonate transport system substrate-binding protein